MAQYITKIRTEQGDKQIDYNALANLPQSDTSLSTSGKFADAKVVGEKIQQINTKITEYQDSTQNINTTLASHTSKVASSTESGHMDAADKAKLDGIAANANNYSLPTASNSVLGGVKTTSSVSSTSGLTACPIIGGVPYYHDNTLKDLGVNVTSTELNMLSGLSNISQKPTKQTVTLSAGAWSNNQQTVSVSGVTTSNLVMVSPEPSSANYSAYSESNIRCISQANGSLTFSREYESSLNISVNVVVFKD